MKVEWEEGDIVPGRRIFKPGCGITGAWMFSWRIRRREERDDNDLNKRIGDNVWGLVSLADGMVINVGSGTKAAVAQHLNNAGYYMPFELLDPNVSRFSDKDVK